MAAWRYAGAEASRTLCGACDQLLLGYSPHTEFLQSLAVYILKGEEHDDTTEGPIRAPVDTRPLGLKNTDNRVICSVINFKLREVTAKCAN